MKRIVCILLALLLSFSMTACFGKDNGESSSSPTSSSSETPPPENGHTVGFYEGTTLIATLTVADGTVLKDSDIPAGNATRRILKALYDGTPITSDREIQTLCVDAAIYDSADGVVPMVSEAPIMDGVRDAMYDGALTLVHDGNHAVYPAANKRAGDPLYPGVGEIEAQISFLWDGTYLYCLIEVLDSTLVSAGEDYIASTENPFKNDTVELWYNFGTRHDFLKQGLDAYGHKLFAGGGVNQSEHLADIRAQNLYGATQEDGFYTVEFAILLTEESEEGGGELAVGSHFYAGLEVLDIVTSDPSSPYFEKYCSTGVQCLNLDAADMALVWTLLLGAD